jgi:hypothetical protein
LETTSIDSQLLKGYDTAELKGYDTGISSYPFYEPFFDLAPLLELELVLDRVGVIKERNFVGNILESETNLGQEGLSRSSGNIGIRGRSIQQKFGRTGSTWDGKH